MLIREFINEVVDDIGFESEEFRDKLLRVKLQQIEDKVLNVTNFITKTFKVTVPTDEIVRLPYDFRYPKKLMVNDTTELERVDSWEVGSDETLYSVETKRVNLSESKQLILKPYDIEYMNINIRRSEYRGGYTFQLLDDAGAVKFGEIFDNRNIYYLGNILDETDYGVKIQAFDASDNPALYSDIIRFEDDDIIELMTIYGKYAIVLNQGIKEYYIAENGFTYSDIALTTLLTRGNIANNNLILKFGSISAGDTISMEYVASAQQYINENQISIVLDTFHDLVLKGAIAYGYKYLRKPQKESMALNEFNEALRIASAESGRINNFGKQRRWIPKNVSKTRLPI